MGPRFGQDGRIVIGSRNGDSSPRIVPAVARFVLGTLAAIAVVVVGGFFALRSVTIKEAGRNTRDQVRAQGRLVESGGLTDGVLRGDARALERLDNLVLGQVLSP